MKRTMKAAWMAALATAVLVQTASAQTGKAATAAFRFVNRSGADIQIRASGGFEREFLVDDGGTVVQEAGPGSVTEIAYWPPWGDGYQERQGSPRRLTLRAPGAGMTNDVALTLVRRTGAEPGASVAWVDFRNPLGVPVRITPYGEWGKTAGPFDISANGNFVRVCRAGEKLAYEVSTPYSSDFQPAFREATAPAAGITNRVVIALEKAVDQFQDYATVTLYNPNEAEVFVSLQGGYNGSVLVAAGDTKELPVASDKNTVLSWYAIGSSRFKEISPETAQPGTAAPKAGGTTVELVLTKLAAPVLTVRNVGEVALAVSVGGANATIEPKQTAKFPNLPVDRELRLEWESEQAGFQDDSRRIGPYVWGQQAEERIQSVRMVPPRLEISNDSDWPMKVSVSQVGGTWTAATNRLEGGARWELEVEGAGKYRVRTMAIPDPKSALANPDDYEKTDRTVECRWGMPTEVSCTANPLPGASSDFAIADQLIASVVRGSLRQAVNVAKADWVGHAIQSNIRKIDEALAKAKQYAVAEGVDADGLAAGVASYGEWSESVGAKADISYDDVWQRIVETTESSRNWEEFLAEVSCTANPLPGASSDFAIADQLIASVVRGSLRQAVNVAKADWGGHAIQSNIWKIDEALAKAKQYAVAEGVDADGLAAGVASYGEWSESVGAKADISYDDVWQRIVETTESSRNWEEFLANY